MQTRILDQQGLSSAARAPDVLLVWFAGYFEVMFSQQVAPYNQDLGVTLTSPMQMNWLYRAEVYAWYFLPPITSILILWW